MKLSKALLLYCLAFAASSCVDYADQPNRPYDYTQLDVSFSATLPKNYVLEEGALFGIRGLCTRNEVQNTEMSAAGIARFAYDYGSDLYLYKSADGEAIVARKGDHNYRFYAYYPYDASVSDLSAIPVTIPSVLNWSPTDTPDLSMLLAASTTVSSVIAPVPLAFEAVAQCRMTIRIPDTEVPVIKSLRIAPVNESVYRGQLAWSGTYNLLEGKAVKDDSSSSKSITVNFGSGYTLPSGYTEISFVMAAFSYPSGGLQLVVTKGDGSTVTKKMYDASKVFAAGSTTVYTFS